MDVSFGVALPQRIDSGPGGRAELIDYLIEVEELGYGSVWTQEQLLGTDPSLEPLAALAFAAAAPTSLGLGTATVVGPLRDPILLAKTTATIDRLSGGRLRLGLSIGEVAEIFDAVGVDIGERGRRLDELVAILRMLWTEDHASHQGRFWSFADATMSPKPSSEPHPPLYFGGHSDIAMERVARCGSGWIAAGGSPLASLAADVDRMVAAATNAGRRRTEIVIGKKLYVATGPHARPRLDRWFSDHWPASFDAETLARDAGVAGTLDEVSAVIESIAASGVDLIILNPVFDVREQMRRLAELIPHRQSERNDR